MKTITIGRHLRSAVAAGLVMLAASPSLAGARGEAPIRVLTLDSSRTDVCGPIDYNIAVGNFFEDLRAALADAANFGPEGVVTRAVELLQPVPRITGLALEEADVVLLSGMAVPLDGCEQTFLRGFVEQGGGVFAFHNSAAMEVGPVFEANGRAGVRGGSGTVMVRSSALTDGPFGAIPRKVPLMWHRVFSRVGRFGTDVIHSSGGGPWCASFQMLGGRGVLVCDEEWIGSAVDVGCAVPNLDDDKMTLFLNSFAFVTPVASFEYVRLPVVLGDLNDDCKVDGADLGLLRALWGTDSALGDLNGDGVVDGADLGLLLAAWT